MAVARISKRTTLVGAVAFTAFVVGVLFIARAVLTNDADPAPKSAYVECIDEATEHLQSFTTMSAAQAREQASTSAKCSALSPANQVTPAAGTLGIKLDTGTNRDTYARLYEQICDAVANGNSKPRILDRLQVLYVPTDAEFIFEEALGTC